MRCKGYRVSRCSKCRYQGDSQRCWIDTQYLRCPSFKRKLICLLRFSIGIVSVLVCMFGMITCFLSSYSLVESVIQTVVLGFVFIISVGAVWAGWENE
jgi:antibiotic biosynthesis monooxygenase (ABM) superfamily enzyme